MYTALTKLADYHQRRAAAAEERADAAEKRALALESWAAALEKKALGLRSSAMCDQCDEPSHPPNGACFLLDLLLVEADREVITGDLEEEFTTSILPKYGARRAHIWFWIQTVRTIATRNAICRWILAGGLVRIGEWIFRQIGG